MRLPPALVVVLAALAATPAAALTPSLVRDINPSPRSESSRPREMTVPGGVVVYSAFEAAVGSELWAAPGPSRTMTAQRSSIPSPCEPSSAASCSAPGRTARKRPSGSPTAPRPEPCRSSRSRAARKLSPTASERTWPWRATGCSSPTSTRRPEQSSGLWRRRDGLIQPSPPTKSTKSSTSGLGDTPSLHLLRFGGEYRKQSAGNFPGDPDRHCPLVALFDPKNRPRTSRASPRDGDQLGLVTK